MGFLFLRPVTMYHVHFINLWLDLHKLTKSLHRLTELKMTLQSVILFQKCNKVHIH